MLLRQVHKTLGCSRRYFCTKGIDDFSSSIAEFNEELESIFGESLASGPSDSIESRSRCAENQVYDVSLASGPSDSIKSRSLCPENQVSNVSGISDRLTHVGHHGKAQMVDVSPNKDTKRTAIVSCKVILGKSVFDLVSANQLAKGDVLTVAKIAGITGAKQTGNLFPLCHNISLSHVQVDLGLNQSDCSVVIKGEASTTAKTGVEMEALTAVAIAGLIVYDMCKAASKNIELTNVRLESKTGGKSGEWSREE